MNIINELLNTEGYIIVNKTLIKAFGLNEAILIGELCAEYSYWEKQGKLEDDMFFSSHKNIEENTGLNEYTQRKILTKLAEQGIIEIKRKGVPATNYYKIIYEQIFKILGSRSLNFKDLDLENLKPNNTIISKDIIDNKKEKNKKENISQKPNSFLGSAEQIKNDINKENIDKFIELYNEHCPSLPKVRGLTVDRRKKIIALFKDYGTQDIITVFDNAEESDFLKGNNDRGWKANIDFIIRPDKFVAILEGKYGGKKKKRFENEGKCVVATPEEERRQEEWRKEMNKIGKQTVF